MEEIKELYQNPVQERIFLDQVYAFIYNEENNPDEENSEFPNFMCTIQYIPREKCMTQTSLKELIKEFELEKTETELARTRLVNDMFNKILRVINPMYIRLATHGNPEQGDKVFDAWNLGMYDNCKEFITDLIDNKV